MVWGINLKLKKNSLKFKTWLCILTYSILILVLLWVIQVLLLNNFYERSKTKDLNKAINEIAEAFNDNRLNKDIESIIRDNGVCAQIYLEKTKIYDMSHINKGCFNDLNRDFISEFINDNKESDTYKFVNTKFNNKVLIKAIRFNNITVFASTSLAPIDATVAIVRNEFIIVSIIVLILSCVIGVIVANKLSNPIIEINNGANELVKGNYDNKLVVNNGISEFEELADTLNKASSELAKTDKLEKELIANVSHDIKTPLTMIKAYAEMVRDLTYKDKKKRDENLNVIIEEVDRLNILVNDMLDYSILESKTKELEITTFDITKVIKDIIKKYAYLSDIKIDFNIKEEVLVSADLHRIEQVMYNLINNAINHVGEDKTVTININKNKIEVSDTGEGIDPKDINHIWKRYYKIDKTHRRDKVGTGIGLSIVATILKQHNFKYGVNSIKNKKTTFWFEFDQK